ncbi:MAG: DUF3267 domain-containing protein [Oscillospiraceae bacterium]|jgi:hypothetical protein|nr:DUF3267 domain-containing protein [Oscillospiraceae bacterium]
MNYDTLPEGFQCVRTVDLKDKKLAQKLNLLALPVFLGLVVPMIFLVPPNLAALPETISGLFRYWLLLLFWLVALIALTILHELIHAFAMRLVAKAKPGFGFTGLVAYCNCETKYICKRHYYVIALAPLVSITILLGVACFLLPPAWFWFSYGALAAHAASAMGDVWICTLFARLPPDILMIDRGAKMDVYSKRGPAD